MDMNKENEEKMETNNPPMTDTALIQIELSLRKTVVLLMALLVQSIPER